MIALKVFNEKIILNPEFYLKSKPKVPTFLFTKKMFQQTCSELNSYHTITACLQTCNFPIPDRKECLGNTQCPRHATHLPLFPVFFITDEPANSTGKILRRLHSLEVTIRPDCLARSCYQLQNGQRDNFTREPLCFPTPE